MEHRVQDGMVVALQYTLRLDDGEVVDESTPGEPLEYIHGQGQIIEGLESALTGLRVGDRRQVDVEPENGYGEYMPDMELEVPREDFPADMTPEVGEAIYVQGNDGDTYPYWIVSVEDDMIVLDPNHPLAGETLHFEVEIVGLRPATKEELEHGHVHSDRDEHHHH